MTNFSGRFSRGALAIAALGLVAALSWWLWPAAPASGKSGHKGMPGSPWSGPVPVRLTEVVRGDFPVELNALGTVTAPNTVSIRPRVGGELVKVLFEEGQQVKAGQLLAQIDPRPYQVALAQAEGTLAQNQAQLDNALIDLTRYQGLFAEDSIAKQTLDTQKALVAQLKGVVKSNQAQVAEARLNLTYTELRAPISGRLGLRQVDLGNLLAANDSTVLVTITQQSPIDLIFTLPEQDIPALRAQWQTGTALSVEAWDKQGQNLLAQGSLASFDNQINPATGTLKLKARFANQDLALFPNQFATLKLRLETRHNVLLIPSATVQFGVQGSFVFVVDEHSKVQVRPIKVAASNGPLSLIEEGLSEGERLVLEGIDQLKDGGQVRVIEDAPAQETAPGKLKESGKPAA